MRNSSIHRQAGRASAPAALMQNCKQIFFHNKKNDLVLLLLFCLPLMGAIAGPMLVKNALSLVGLWWVSQSTVQTSQGKGKRKRTLDACKIPPASLSLSLSHHPIAVIERMLKVWMLKANYGKTDILKAKYKCKCKWYIIWSLGVLVLRGNTKASWSSTTGKAGRQGIFLKFMKQSIRV